MNTATRLVKCPKCRKILPELPNIPVYRCGGCGIILQAKKQKYDMKENDLRAQVTDPIQNYAPNSVSSSSSHGGDNPFVESSPGSDTRGEQSNSAKPAHTNSSDDYSNSTKLNHLQDEKLSPEKNDPEVQGEIERLLDQDDGERKSEPLIHSSEKSHDITSGELSDSCDGFHENEDSFTEISIPVKKYEEGYLPKLNVVTSVDEIQDSHGVLEGEEKCSGEPKSLDQHSTHFSMHKNQMDVAKERQFIGICKNEIEGSDGVLAKEERLSDEPQSLNDPETTGFSKSEPPELVVEKEQGNIGNEIRRYPNDIEDSQGKVSREGKLSNELKSLDESATHFSVNEPLMLDEENEQLSEDEEHNKMDERRYISRDNDKTSQNEFTDQVPLYQLETAKEMLPEITAAQGPSIKRAVLAPLTPDDEYLKEFHEEYLKEFHVAGPSIHRVSSEETLDHLPIHPRVPIGSMSKSPTRIYYAGDESESSYDGTAGLSAQVSRLPIRKFKGTGITSTNRSRRTDGFRFKNGELQMHNERLIKQPNKFSVEEQDWRGQESPEPRKHSHPIRTSTIAANNEPISRGSYMPRSFQLFHRNRIPASSTHNGFLHSGEFHGPDRMSDSDPERNELLRRVHELEDKINRTHVSKQMSGERLSTGGYYVDRTTGRNVNVDFKYSGQQRRHPQGVGWDNQSRSSRQTFSGEASLCRNHTDCRCSHCYHQNLHFSPKLSSHCIHCQHEAYNTYPSYSPSPQHYSSSEYSREIHADKQKHDGEMKMLYLREKHKVMKRHLRPVRGGAPIINCYHCSELLQLPADFILFKRRYHQLKCNSCNRILKFSLRHKSHLIPYAIKFEVPPPSEMDNSSNIVNSKIHSSASHANNPQDAGPVSFSDDLEPSLSRNGSTESGPSLTSNPILKKLSNGKLPSNQTFQAMNYRKMKTFMEIYQDKNSRYDIEAAGPSSSTPRRMKPSSEIEEVHATSGSPLHRLMGYASPRQVLFAKSDDDSDDGMGFYMDQHIR